MATGGHQRSSRAQHLHGIGIFQARHGVQVDWAGVFGDGGGGGGCGGVFPGKYLERQASLWVFSNSPIYMASPDRNDFQGRSVNPSGVG